MAAQSQSLRTNAIKAKIDNSQNDYLCRMSLQKMSSEWPKLAQKEYKQRHDGADLCKQHG